MRGRGCRDNTPHTRLIHRKSDRLDGPELPRGVPPWCPRNRILSVVCAGVCTACTIISCVCCQCSSQPPNSWWRTISGAQTTRGPPPRGATPYSKLRSGAQGTEWRGLLKRMALTPRPQPSRRVQYPERVRAGLRLKRG